MKKKISIIFAILILILTTTLSYATSKVEATLTATSQKLYEKETVVFTLKVDSFQDINHGINAYKGVLEYDKTIFEEVKEANFKALSGWEGLEYNSQTCEFVVYKKAGTTLEENIVEVSLQVKEGVKATKTEVKMLDMVTSQGKEDIYVVNEKKANLEMDIIEEQKPDEKPDDKPIEKPGDQNPEDQDPGEVPPSKPNIEKPNNNKPNGGVQSGNQDNPYQGKLPKTGRNYTMLFLLLAVEVLLAVRAVHFGKKWIASEKTKATVVATLAIVLSMQLIGTVYGAVTTFAQKGELNGDGAINYADVSLLEAHLIHLKPLGED
ncbi:MAG: hypothetical protein HFJ33_06240, partial [Clostridia bacterium]|nr:hypothetical protein [Clostridia bacterium]